ncbi:helix-turn-helix domain-containing protein [Candidatus Poribacteria bacterium]|nr:helix-turn-helix domain-containing protein [Candidatus Poribacteria bacterium]
MRLRLSRLLREKELREGRRIPQEELAAALGVSQQTISVLVRNQNKQVGLETLDRLSAYFGVPVAYLLEEASDAPSAGVKAGVDRVIMLPVLGHVNAGPLDEEHQKILDWYAWAPGLGARPGCYVLIVEGDSMVDAHILPGSRVIVDPKLTPRSGDIVVALLNGGSGLKRIFIGESGDAVLLSENREAGYPPTFVRPSDDIQIQGVVVNIVLTPEPRRFPKPSA